MNARVMVNASLVSVVVHRVNCSVGHWEWRHARGQSAEWEANCFAAFRLAILTSGGVCLPPSRQWCPIPSAEHDIVAALRERYQSPTAVPGSAPVVAGRSRVGVLGGAARSTRPRRPLQ